VSVNRGFASDNNAAIHPDVLSAIVGANVGHAPAYGDDPWTERALQVLEEHFGEGIQAFFVLTGTGANVLGIDAVTEPHHSVICPETAHIHEDECGAPERFTGCKLLSCETPDGRLRPEDVKRHLVGIGFEHHSQPRVISISQTTELGTVYSVAQIRALADLAHENGMLLQMDGARIANAAAALDLPLAAFTRDAGVDILSFGGTKNGMLAGEAVVFFDPEHAQGFEYRRKQAMQLFSKMRFVAAQFEALFGSDLWLENARHANAMGTRLAAGLESVDGVELAQPVEANAVFATLPANRIERLQAAFPFYLWDDTLSLARLMCSFDTNPQDVDAFVDLVRA
jgi:threonine aldolase